MPYQHHEHHDRRRVPDPEAGYASSPPSPTPSASAPSLAFPIRLYPTSPIRLHSPYPLTLRPPSPVPSLDASTLTTVAAAASFLTRTALHLLAFTGGLYLASGLFTTLVPLLDSSWLWAPPVFAACALATLMAPFWGLVALHLLCTLRLPKLEWHWDDYENRDGGGDGGEDGVGGDHTRRLAYAATGVALAGTGVLVALASPALPCREATLACAADAALDIARSLQGEGTGGVAAGVALCLLPLAGAWWYTGRSGVLAALKGAAVTLSLVNVALVLALGRADAALRDELGRCRQQSRV